VANAPRRSLGIIPSAAHPLMTPLFERLQTEHPGIRLNIAESQGIGLDSMLHTGAVDLAILFRINRPNAREEKLLSVAHTYLVSAPGNEITQGPTVNFSRLSGLRLILPRRAAAEIPNVIVYSSARVARRAWSKRAPTIHSPAN